MVEPDRIHTRSQVDASSPQCRYLYCVKVLRVVCESPCSFSPSTYDPSPLGGMAPRPIRRMAHRCCGRRRFEGAQPDFVFDAFSGGWRRIGLISRAARYRDGGAIWAMVPEVYFCLFPGASPDFSGLARQCLPGCL